MPEYTFVCVECGEDQPRIMSVTRYEEALGAPRGELSTVNARLRGEECSGCGGELARSAMADMGSQHSEKQLFWDLDTAPSALAGKGGYSRERQRLLDKHGYRQKDKAPSKRGPKRTKGTSVYYRRDRLDT